MTDQVTCPHCGEVSNIGGLVGPTTDDCPKCGGRVLETQDAKRAAEVKTIAILMTTTAEALMNMAEQCDIEVQDVTIHWGDEPTTASVASLIRMAKKRLGIEGHRGTASPATDGGDA